MKFSELRDATTLRSMIYGFMARSYMKEMDNEHITSTKEILPVLVRYNMLTNDEMLDKGLNMMGSIVDKIKDESKFVEEHAVKFTTIFYNCAYDKAVKYVNPYESIYLSGEHLMMQEQTDQVLECYYEYKLGPVDDFKEPADHIAAELSFLYRLNGLIAEDFTAEDTGAVLSKLKSHKKFMEEHLLKWVHLMGKDLREADPKGFYCALADITMGFIRQDYNFLCDMEKHIQDECINA